MNILNRLMTIGYTHEEALHLIYFYESNGNLQCLINYCKTKESIVIDMDITEHRSDCND